MLGHRVHGQPLAEAVPVVNDQVTAAVALPAGSRTPVSTTECTWPAGNGSVGEKITVRVAES